MLPPDPDESEVKTKMARIRITIKPGMSKSQIRNQFNKAARMISREIENELKKAIRRTFK